ncbi:MAG: 16S rRNA (cytidine(1402)-2'-O)-methyltransferase, partial [Gammaproteobacteria bacterium]
ESLEVTFILYESPHRLLKTLEVIGEVFNNPPTVVAKELTKLHEEYIRGETTEEVIRYFKQNPDKVRGEFVILFRPQERVSKDHFDLKGEVLKLKERGLSAKEIYKTLKEKGFKVDRREVYRIYGEL